MLQRVGIWIYFWSSPPPKSALLNSLIACYFFSLPIYLEQFPPTRHLHHKFSSWPVEGMLALHVLTEPSNVNTSCVDDKHDDNKV